MAIEIEEGSWERPEDDAAVIYQLQTVLLNAVEGEKSDKLNSEYFALRKGLMNSEVYRPVVPRFIQDNRDLKSMWSFLKSVSDTWEPRRQMVRGELRPLLIMAEERERQSTALRSSSWTGTLGGAERIVAVKALVPVTQAAIETLIASLETPKGNGAPLLDEHDAAIAHLRKLHSALGDVLELAENGQLNTQIGEGLVKELISYGKRAAKQLRDDPIPYAMSALLLAVFSALGDSMLGGYMAGIATNIRRTMPKY